MKQCINVTCADQEAMQKGFPEMVHTGSDGYKPVDYSHMTHVLLQTIKEQQLLIENLEHQLQTAQQANAALEASNTALQQSNAANCA